MSFFHCIDHNLKSRDLRVCLYYLFPSSKTFAGTESVLFTTSPPEPSSAPHRKPLFQIFTQQMNKQKDGTCPPPTWHSVTESFPVFASLHETTVSSTLPTVNTPSRNGNVPEGMGQERGPHTFLASGYNTTPGTKWDLIITRSSCCRQDCRSRSAHLYIWVVCRSVSVHCGF